MKKAPEAETFCLLIYMPRKVLINPSKLISRRGNEPLQHYVCVLCVCAGTPSGNPLRIIYTSVHMSVVTLYMLDICRACGSGLRHVCLLGMGLE